MMNAPAHIAPGAFSFEEDACATPHARHFHARFIAQVICGAEMRRSVVQPDIGLGVLSG
jgi:hypothetical protein